jgi:hypothetical protein
MTDSNARGAEEILTNEKGGPKAAPVEFRRRANAASRTNH